MLKSAYKGSAVFVLSVLVLSACNTTGSAGLRDYTNGINEVVQASAENPAYTITETAGVAGYGYAYLIEKANGRMGFVDAVQALGGNWVWNSWFHILPNAGFRLIPLATVHVAWAFIGATTLTFLGFAGDPSLPEWGSMLNAGRLHLVQMPLLAILPGVAMSFTILSIHNLGTWLARISNPYPGGWQD